MAPARRGASQQEIYPGQPSATAYERNFYGVVENKLVNYRRHGDFAHLYGRNLDAEIIEKQAELASVREAMEQQVEGLLPTRGHVEDFQYWARRMGGLVENERVQHLEAQSEKLTETVDDLMGRLEEAQRQESASRKLANDAHMQIDRLKQQQSLNDEEAQHKRQLLLAKHQHEIDNLKDSARRQVDDCVAETQTSADQVKEAALRNQEIEWRNQVRLGQEEVRMKEAELANIKQTLITTQADLRASRDSLDGQTKVLMDRALAQAEEHGNKVSDLVNRHRLESDNVTKQHQQMVGGLQQTIEGLENQRDAAQQNAATVNATLRYAQDELDVRGKRVEELEMVANERSAELKQKGIDLSQALADHATLKEEAEVEIATAQNQRDSLAQSCGEKDAELEDLKKQLADKDTVAAMTWGQYEDLKAELEIAYKAREADMVKLGEAHEREIDRLRVQYKEDKKKASRQHIERTESLHEVLTVITLALKGYKKAHQEARSFIQVLKRSCELKQRKIGRLESQEQADRRSAAASREDQLLATYTDMSRMRNDLQIEIDKATKPFVDRNVKLEKEKTELMEQAGRVSDLEFEVWDLQRKVRTLEMVEANCRELQQKMRDLESEAMEAEYEKEGAIQDAESRVKREYNAVIAQERMEKTTLRQGLLDSQRAGREADTTIRNLDDKLSRLGGQLSQLWSRNDRLSNQALQQRDDLSRASEAYAVQSRDLNNSNARINSLMQQLTNANERIKVIGEHLADATDKRDRLLEARKTQNSLVADLEATIGGLEGERKEKADLIDRLKLDAGDKAETIEALKAKIEKKQRTVEVLKGDLLGLVGMGKEVEELEEKVRELLVRSQES